MSTGHRFGEEGRLESARSLTGARFTFTLPTVEVARRLTPACLYPVPGYVTACGGVDNAVAGMRMDVRGVEVVAMGILVEDLDPLSCANSPKSICDNHECVGKSNLTSNTGF